MQRWDLNSIEDGSRRGPRVVFSTPEARAVVIDLEQDELMGDHRVRERAIVQVISGAARITSGADVAHCAAGSLIVFEPSETHSVHALEPTRLLLTLAPWPAPGHYDEGELEDPHELPAHATQPPADDQSAA
jgi:quercetin dioxygenase-like cupin family protein